MDLYFFSAAPTLSVTLDSGEQIAGVRCTHKDREAYRVTIPSGSTGGMLVETPGFTWAPYQRGLLILPNEGNPEYTFALDDIIGDPTPAPGPEPTPPTPPNPYADPSAIIMDVYARGAYDLSTKAGCGTYTEDCVTALHTQQSGAWGHIRKTPGQNNWQGHAVDAVLLLAQMGNTAQGCYDIIWSTESAEAKPIWTYKGPDPNAANVWYYGPMPCPPL